MPTSTVNLEIEQGTTWAHGWAVTYTGAPVDSTWSARGQVRDRAASPTVLHTFAASVDADGNVVIAVEPATSSAWSWRSGVYDVEIQSADGVVLRVASGHVSVSAEVTR